MTKEYQDAIRKLVETNRVVIFMKGTKDDCTMFGESFNAVQILKQYDVEFKDVDVLSDPPLRQEIKEYATWATLPQIYIDGQFVGGDKILDDLHRSGELSELLGTEANAILYDERGFRPINGLHRNGTAYDDYGFDVKKIHQNGTSYDDQGFAFDGYNAQGYERNGYNRDGFNQQGYDRDGYDCDGFNLQGYNKGGYGRDGFNLQGYTRDGYGRDGFNGLGYTRDGYGRDGNQYRVIQRNTPVHNRNEDNAWVVAVQKDLANWGLPREKFRSYFFTDNLWLNVVYAGDTPNISTAQQADHFQLRYRVIY